MKLKEINGERWQRSPAGHETGDAVVHASAV